MSSRTQRKFSSLFLMGPLLALLLASNLGCSYRWREADAGKDWEQIQEELGRISTNIESSGGTDEAGQYFFQLLEDPNSAVYFSEAGPLGTVPQVFAFNTYYFLDEIFHDAGPATFLYNVENVQIYFVTAPTGGGDDCALLINVKFYGDVVEELGMESIPHFFTCTGLAGTSKGEYIAELQNASGMGLMLTSYDVYSDGQLKDVIQLQVYDSAFGDYERVGKFSTLVRY
jgi:hypothetical protein